MGAHGVRRRRAGANVAQPRALYVEGRALAVGTLLTTPYLFMYDLMVLAIPVAFLVRIGPSTAFVTTNFRRWAARHS